MQWGVRKYKFNKWVVALRIVFFEVKKRRSLKPLKLLWKKTFYGTRFPYRIRTTLPEWVNFCRINNISVISIPEEELA